MKSAGESPRTPDADFEAVLVECLEQLSSRGAAGVSEVCARHPELEERLRGRLATLERLGLLAAEDGPGEGSRERPGAPSAAGNRIGAYRLVRPLGRGGMAVVHLARGPDGPDGAPGPLVALKCALAPLSGEGAGPGRARARFEREVRALEGLRHPGVVPVLDSGEDGGRPWFTMEYVQGATLAQVVAALAAGGHGFDELTGLSLGQVVAAAVEDHAVEDHAVEDPAVDAGPPATASLAGWSRSYFETVTRIVLQVAEALEHLHEHGVLHRDVKPSNVLLRGDGRALLFDLGLAHVADQPALTRSGDFTGTPYYVSPEQVAHGPKRLDARSDVYSLGVTLYELLTLRRPFEGRGTAQVLRSIAVEEPRLPRRVNPLVPRGLETICLTAMEKDPARRYASARELADDLRRFLDFKPVRARPVGALARGVRFVRRQPAQAAALALAGLVVVGLPTGLALANRAVREQRDLAAANADAARRQVDRNARQIDFLVGLFEATEAAFERRSDSQARGGDPTPGDAAGIRAMIDRSAERIDVEFEDEPLVRAALLEATGRVYANLGLYEPALGQLDRSLALLQQNVEEHHPDLIGALELLAATHLAAGSLEDAVALGRRAQEALDELEPRDRALELRAGITLADALAAQGNSPDARAVLAELESPTGTPLASIERRLGSLALHEGALAEARTHLERALVASRSEPVPDVVEVADTLSRLAHVARAQGDRAGAEAYALRAASIEARWSESTPPGVPTGGAADALLAEHRLIPEWMEEYDDTFQAGVTAIQAGRYAEAVEHFERCLELEPDRPACAYNIACSQAQLGRVDEALDWLERSIDMGMGLYDRRWLSIQQDPDLDPVRSRARYRDLLARGEAQRALSRDLREPVFRPAPSVGRRPLLVVLHPDGGAGATLAEPDGLWARLADELDLALLAPTGPLPFPASPPDTRPGHRWFEDVRELLRRPGLHGREVLEAIEATLGREGVDPRGVILAGQGEAAPLAFDLALRAPGRFRGVLLLDGGVLPGVAAERLRRAAALELAVAVRFRSGAALAGRPQGAELAAHIGVLGDWLRRSGLRGGVESLAGGGAEASGLAEAVRGLLAPPP